MSEDAPDEVLLLKDETGKWYAIPREVVDTYVIADEHAAEVEEAVSGEVAGFALRPAFEAVSVVGLERLGIVERYAMDPKRSPNVFRGAPGVFRGVPGPED
jgi:hypothetical protein